MDRRAILFLLIFAVVAATAHFLSLRVSPQSAPDRYALLSEALEGLPPQVTAAPSVPVPILVYHVVRPSYPSDTAELKSFAVTPEVFTAQLKWLSDRGYHVVSFDALVAHISQGAALPAKSIVITLDDDWENQYLYAFPILKQFGYTATFFVPSNFPGNKSFISWDHLREIIAAGMTVESHSESHPFLTKLSSTALTAEIAGSKAKLEAQLGVPITTFAYPYGAYNPAVIAAVKAAGYTAARGDAYNASSSESNLLTLPGLNVPNSLGGFQRYFP